MLGIVFMRCFSSSFCPFFPIAGLNFSGSESTKSRRASRRDWPVITLLSRDDKNIKPVHFLSQSDIPSIFPEY